MSGQEARIVLLWVVLVAAAYAVLYAVGGGF